MAVSNSQPYRNDMVKEIERLEGLLEDAARIAETSHNAQLLRHLHEARGSIRTSENTAAPIRVDVLSGRVFYMDLPVPCTRAELAVVIALSRSEVGLSREALVDLLYPDHDVSRSTNILKVYVHRARRRIPTENFICSEHGRLRLGRSVDVDLRRLVREADLLRCRGGGLDEDVRRRMEHFRSRLAEGRPPMMLEWTWFEDTERALVDLTKNVTALLAEDALRERQYQRAIMLAHELTYLDPLDEFAAEVAIRALVLAGNHMAAVLEYRRYASVLEREIDAEPSPHLRALVVNRVIGP